MKPIILITAQFDLENGREWIASEYVRAVQSAGGVPVVLPVSFCYNNIGSVLEKCDGVLFTGGPDFDEAYYNMKAPGVKTRVSPERDAVEFPLMRMALDADKAVLGICRGVQLMCIVSGGKLCQDIAECMKNREEHDMDPPFAQSAHNIIIEESPLLQLTGKKLIGVNSRHHQSISECGNGMEIMASSPGGVVEAVYIKNKRFAWGVQWHPELMGDDVSEMLFAEFIRNAK